MTPPRTRLSHDQRLVLLALGAVAPGAILALVLLWTGDHNPRTQWTLTIAMAILVAGFLASLRARVIMVCLSSLSLWPGGPGPGFVSIRPSDGHARD